jgi:hypothetical protein
MLSDRGCPQKARLAAAKAHCWVKKDLGALGSEHQIVPGENDCWV